MLDETDNISSQIEQDWSLIGLDIPMAIQVYQVFCNLINVSIEWDGLNNQIPVRQSIGLVSWW